MDLFRKKIDRIKNAPKGPNIPKDFSYNSISYFILGLFAAGGVFWQLNLTPDLEPLFIIKAVSGFIFSGILLTILSLWAVAILLIMSFWMSLYFLMSEPFYPLFISLVLGILLSCSIQLVYHWDKVVLLRFGRFRKTKGAGVFFLLPLIDRIADFIDTRIRATDFSAEKTLTMDTVPVHVDALCFWMVWDAQKAVLEVENFTEAVTLSAQTALRDAIGRHELSSLLSEREQLGQEIQQALDSKTNPWGVSIMSVEITDIIIPRELEDAMSKRAQAERERQSRAILGDAEIEVAHKFKEASLVYENHPAAMQLRAMNMVYEGIRQNKGSLMVLPSSALDNMNLGAVAGTAALNKIMQQEQNQTQQSDKEQEVHDD